MLERKREYVTNTSGSAAEWRFHMTAQGQEIMNRLAILPETNYGPYQFKNTIANTISSVIGEGPKVERTLQRMTELGMLVWSKTGKMAKVVDTEKTYRVMMCSDGGTRRVMYSGLTEERAYDICRDYGWQVDLGYIWRLEIEEE